MNQVSDGAQFFRYSAEKLTPISEPGVEVRLGVADSWLVESGLVRNLAAHFERFEKWVGEVDQSSSSQLESFFQAVRAEIPRDGDYFPRIEHHLDAPPGERLHLRLRVAPQLSPSVKLWLFDEQDPRQNPTVKGPDLSLGMQLRRKAKLHGADEAVLLTDKGFVNEGALSSLVWWRGDVLCSTPAEGADWLPSITRDSVFALARDTGKSIRLEFAEPESLADTEVWLLSSLQGIKPATGIFIGQEFVQFATPSRAESFQRRLRLLSSSIEN